MGLQPIGTRKTRQAIAQTGVSFTRLRRLNNGVWLGAVDGPDSHEHWWVDPVTWDVELDDGPCWTTCETPRETPAGLPGLASR